MAVSIPESRVRALLADLVANAGEPLSVDRLIDDMWPAVPPANPVASLHTKVSQLRRALEDAEPGGRDCIVTTPTGYLFRAEPYCLDSVRFLAFVERAQRASDPRLRVNMLRDALAMWRGPAFADFLDLAFSREAANTLEEARIAARSELAELRLELGEHRSLVAEINELVREHPLRENLRSIQMRALYRAGRAADALDSFAELRALLAETRGADPSREIVDLHRAILDQDPALLPEVPEGEVLSAGHNLPEPPNPLIGRDAMVEEVTAQVLSDRLVTLIGSGGVGKTRVALAIAGGLVDSFADGVWFIEFDGLDRAPGPDALADTILGVLGVDVNAPPPGYRARSQPPGRVGAIDRIVAFLRGRRALLVLDNCEHVVEAAARLVEAVLAERTECRILATSRAPLAVRGETIVPVAPLALPDAETASVERLVESSAAQLFAARVPGLRFDDANCRDITAVCRKLDGLPLALELAATKVRVFGVRELLAQLDRRFQVLSGGFRDAPDRHRSLRAAIDWSWELLSEPERDMLCWIAIHAEDCSLAAVGALFGDAGDSCEVLTALARLVDQSLVVMHEGRDGPRYRLLESISAYCVERLEAMGELAEWRARHARYYAALGEVMGPALLGPDQLRQLERLDVDGPNLRKASDFALARRDARLAMRLVSASLWYGFLRCRLTEMLRYLSALAELGEELRPVERTTTALWRAGIELLIGDGDPRRFPPVELSGDETSAELFEYARGEWLLGYAQWYTGALEESEESVGHALATFRALENRWGIAVCLSTRAAQRTGRSELAVVRRCAQESAAMFAEIGDRWGRLKAIEALGVLAEIEGRYTEARTLHREGLRIVEDLGLWTEIPHKLALLGRIALLQGEFDVADELHNRSMRLAASHANWLGEGFAEIGLALSARRQGKLDDAQAHLTRWVHWLRDIGAHNGLALVLAELGFIADLRGDAAAAHELHSAGLEAAMETGDIRAVALALEGLAGAQTLAGHYTTAARLLGAAEGARCSAAAPLPGGERTDVERITTTVRTALGDDRFAVEYHQGRPLIVGGRDTPLETCPWPATVEQVRRVLRDHAVS
ncbi:BTAD domain-containing putative transcriptional regulator [Nocardia puris]|uniref:BTAD domain-containing putative transcriptional regulator n=1 Tax=Nocardia puris TaxID=208602 RepID=UPI0018DBC4FD|nr:BTAD domain-containing putative transcriptional regulator [Nocardia puris]